MAHEELKTYRGKLEEQKKEREADFHSIITYISAGALGLFLTVNEKFIELSTAVHKWLMIISITFLFLTFGFVLLINYLNSKFNSNLIDTIDEIITGKKQDTDLQKQWKDKSKIVNNLTSVIISCLLIGVLSEVIFLSFNLFKTETKKEQNNKNIKVEIITLKQTPKCYKSESYKKILVIDNKDTINILKDTTIFTHRSN